MRLKRIAYLMSWFPAVTETFILNEILDLERRGLQIEVLPLFGGRCGAFHPGSEKLIARTQYTSYASRELWSALGYWLRLKPAVVLRALWLTVIGNLRSPMMLLKSLVVFPKALMLARRIQDQGLTHVHAHWATFPALAAWIIRELTGIPYSFTTHAHDLYVDRAMLDRKVADAEFVVTISEFNRRLIGREYGEAAANKTHIVHCGIDPDRFRPVNRVRTEKVTIACVASLRDYKGHEYLIEACRHLKVRNVRFQALFAGEGEERPRLEQLIRDANLTTEVTLLGAVPQTKVAKLLASADVMVLPSVTTSYGKMEGIPVSLMEAMAAGVPVVATAISGIPELVKDGQTGFLVPERDGRALADAIEVLARDPKRATQLALAGREYVVKHFSQQSNIDVLHALLVGEGDSQLVAGAGRKRAAAAVAAREVEAAL